MQHQPQQRQAAKAPSEGAEAEAGPGWPSSRHPQNVWDDHSPNLCTTGRPGGAQSMWALEYTTTTSHSALHLMFTQRASGLRAPLSSAIICHMSHAFGDQ